MQPPQNWSQLHAEYCLSFTTNERLLCYYNVHWLSLLMSCRKIHSELCQCQWSALPLTAGALWAVHASYSCMKPSNIDYCGLGLNGLRRTSYRMIALKYTATKIVRGGYKSIGQLTRADIVFLDVGLFFTIKGYLLEWQWYIPRVWNSLTCEAAHATLLPSRNVNVKPIFVTQHTSTIRLRRCRWIHLVLTYLSTYYNVGHFTRRMLILLHVLKVKMIYDALLCRSFSSRLQKFVTYSRQIYIASDVIGSIASCGVFNSVLVGVVRTVTCMFSTSNVI